MKRKLWKVKELDPRAKELSQKHSLSIFLVQVLLNRRINEDKFRDFLEPSLSSLHSPFLLPDIQKAADRIQAAISRKEKVLVFGDYDVDGITALAIFHDFSQNFPGLFSFYIPHRVKEGYGLNRGVVVKAKEDGVDLIIAFDCGTNAQAEIELAATFGIDVVVVDHHYPKSSSPLPAAFVNPKRKDSVYPFPDLSAAALSFKLLQVLTGSDCYAMLDLVALSLVCDVVPLNGENRILLKEGLKVVRESRRPAIRALCAAGSIKQEKIDVFHIGYVLGPRINASGRVAHPRDAFELFLTEDETRAIALARRLNEYNRLRKDIEVQILREAEQIVQDNIDNAYAIVVSKEGWHPGVLGIVASRLTDKYSRPSFVISFDQDIGKGSVRSTQNVHLISVLDKCADSLIMYGGHSKAAGVHIAKSELLNFKDKINSVIETEADPRDFIPVIDIDAALNFSDIDTDFAESLQRLRPYGEGNPAPLFTAANISKRGVSKRINYRSAFWFSDGNMTLEGVVYDKNVQEVLEYGENFDLVFSVDKNYYHNLPRLIIRDCRLA